jgi:anaerobic ribonucleoside-triphosphate reductase
LTGSIGVVTINIPRIGYLAKDEDEFFEQLSNLMNVAKASLKLNVKRWNASLKTGCTVFKALSASSKTAV